MRQQVLVLAGPTACGKTELALALAERLGAEIVGADSRQIYRGMPIGTAAPTDEQRARVPHHLVGFLDPQERYSAARFVNDARRTIAQIHARGHRAIVVGGTGFYLRALCGDVALSPAYDPALRDRLAREARIHPPEVLHAWLAVRDPMRAASVAVSDPYRIVRALEIALVTSGEAAVHPSRGAARSAKGEMEEPTGAEISKFEGAKVWLEIDPQELERRIERRVDAMLRAGFLEEAQRIGASAVAADAVGYPHALAYLQGWMTLDELRALLVRATRRYAKRQRTWFRAEPRVTSVPVGDGLATLERLARERLGWA
ncbi:MAG TPA: tRNA (adenosine(37)-N6)-dimethylallyltransferase MiaA [Candidatus Acidoferrales bacterium]|nr:tRNA (adenosine(37)-N6)-dimethylallyltransferase MiaA [Candidatus Acidoferrales bacterium]